jgi:hypothetical protein
MNKIITGILGILVVTGLVAGIGYALFTDTVSINGMVLGTTTPGLQICNPLGNCSKTLDLTNLPADKGFGPLSPGQMDWGDFYIENNSTGTYGPTSPDKLNFNLKAQLVGTPTSIPWNSWNLLKDAIQMRICIYNDTPAYHCDEAKATPWRTLSFWQANEVSLPGGTLEQGSSERYTILFRIPESYTNDIAAKKITGVNFVLTGTQVN